MKNYCAFFLNIDCRETLSEDQEKRISKISQKGYLGSCILVDECSPDYEKNQAGSDCMKITDSTKCDEGYEKIDSICKKK